MIVCLWLGVEAVTAAAPDAFDRDDDDDDEEEDIVEGSFVSQTTTLSLEEEPLGSKSVVLAASEATERAM